MIDAIVFDFDGVIANSEPLHFRAFRDVLADQGVELSEADYYGRYLGYDDVGVFRAVASDRGQPWATGRIASLVSLKAVQLETLEADGSVLFPGAADAIHRAAARAPLAIASGALGAEIRRVLDRSGLASAFHVIVAAEDTSKSKPAPDPYLKALSLLSEMLGTRMTPSRSIAIEDSRWGIVSARAAGLRTVAVAQTYARDALSEADLVLSSIGDLDLDALDRLCDH